MSLFIAMLAFDDPALIDEAKRGIIVGSFLAGIAAAMMLRAGRRTSDGN
jgi:NhaA family Na+:H+ antiporter